MFRSFLKKQFTLLLVLLQSNAEKQNADGEISDQSFEIITHRLNEASIIVIGIIETLIGP